MAISEYLCPRFPHIALKNFPGKGRGVIATSFIPAETLVEVSPVLVVPPSEVASVKNTFFKHYIFEWYDDTLPEEEDYYALILGLSSLLNHSADCNLDWECNAREQTMSFFAVRDIEKGEELTIDYGCELWFDEAE